MWCNDPSSEILEGCLRRVTVIDTEHLKVQHLKQVHHPGWQSVLHSTGARDRMLARVMTCVHHAVYSDTHLQVLREFWLHVNYIFKQRLEYAFKGIIMLREDFARG